MCHYMAAMAKTKISSRACHPDRTQMFLTAVAAAEETFDDEITSFDKEVKSRAYKHFLNAYKEALTPVWNLARFADMKIIL